MARVQHGRWADPGRVTVEEYLTRWDASRPVGFGLRATSANTYRYQIKWVLPHIGSIHIRDLEPDHVRGLYRILVEHGGRNGQPLAVRTVRGIHACLHKAFEDALDDGLLVRNPVDRVRAPAADRGNEMRVWDEADALRFLEAIRTDRLYAMWFLFLTTGMRRGEVAGLRWKDVSLRAGRIAVRNQRTCIDGKVVTNDPKTSGSGATISIDAALIEVLRAQEVAQKAERLFVGPAWADTGYVFVRPDGQPYHPQQLTRMFHRIVARVGLPPIRLHDLRHTCATLLIDAGVPLKVVQERLRHRSYSTTADLYAWVTPTMQQDAAVLIESLLAPGSSTSGEFVGTTNRR